MPASDVNEDLGLIDTSTGLRLVERVRNNGDGTFSREVYVSNEAAGGGAAKGAKTLTGGTVGTTAASILAANAGRKEAVITNTSVAATLYIGPSNVSTSVYMYALAPGQPWIDGSSSDAWWAVASAASTAYSVEETA